MAVDIPVKVKVTEDQLPKVKAEFASLSAEEKKAIQARLRDLSFQRRLESEINRELKERIRDHQRLNSLTNKLNRELEQQKKGGFGGGIAGMGMGKLATGAAALGVGAFAGDFIRDSFQAASAAKVTEQAFNNLSGGLENAQDNMDAMARATRGLINEQEQQAIANQLLGMQLVKTDEELEKLVGGSRRLGATFRGMGAAEAAEEFAVLLANMSFERLDQFGLSSGKVRQRVNELKDAGKGAEEAFKTAVFEEMDKTLQRLGPEVETMADGFQRIKVASDNLKVSFGELMQAGGDGGLAGTFATLLSEMDKGAKFWTFYLQQTDLMVKAQQQVETENIKSGDTWTALAQIVKTAGSAVTPVKKEWLDLLDFSAGARQGNEQLIKTYQELNEQLKEQNTVLGTNTDTVTENTEALEKEKKRLERVKEVREDFARSLIEADRKAQIDTAKAWDDYFEDEADEWKDHNERVLDLRADAAKDLARIDRDLQKDLAKNAKDLQKDLAKINKDEKKEIADLKKQAAKEEKQERQKRQIDAKGDERLFQFELRQLAAEGDAAAIAQALERREIEKQIEAEKKQFDQQTKERDLQDEIQQVRQQAEEERAEARAAAEERRTELLAQAEEDKALRQEQLAEQLEEERANYQERLADLRQHREEKLAEIEQTKLDTIAKHAEELASVKELTKAEGKELIRISEKFGYDAGVAAAEGWSGGWFDKQQISELLGTDAASSGVSRSTRGRSPISRTSFEGGTPSRQLMNFDDGGIVPGPIGTPQLAIVHSGERIIPPGQSRSGNISITLQINNPIFSNLVTTEQVMAMGREMLQDFIDGPLAEALS